MEDEQPIFEYNGRAYVRPVGRGICLEEHPQADRLQLEELLPEGDCWISIVVYAKEPEDNLP